MAVPIGPTKVQILVPLVLQPLVVQISYPLPRFY